MNRCFRGAYPLNHHGEKTRRARNNVSSNWQPKTHCKEQRASVASYYIVIPSSPNLVTLMMQAIHSSETSVPTGATRRNIPEDVIVLCILAGHFSLAYTTKSGRHEMSLGRSTLPSFPCVRQRAKFTDLLISIGR
jgi:hypothetical protein